VASLARYPVKSMRGEALDEAFVTWNGLLADRRYAFVRADAGSSFPWLTGRQAAEYILFEPSFERPPSPAEPEPPLVVSTPDGDRLAIDDPRLRALLEERFGHPLYLLHTHRGAFDEAHVSLFGLPTLRQLGAEVGRPLERERFRANVYLQPVDDEPFAEDSWIGRTLLVGDAARLTVVRRDKRCVMTTIDPTTAETEPAVLRAIVQRHEQCAGVFASVIASATIRVGDPIYLVD
jgi:uncharacterized protein YcbX